MDIIPRESNRVLLANHNRSKAICDLYELCKFGNYELKLKHKKIRMKSVSNFFGNACET